MAVTLFFTSMEADFSFVDNDWKEKADYLGLESQKKAAENLKGNANLFMECRIGLRYALSVLFPIGTRLEQFEAYPLPSAVLDALCVAMGANYFNGFEVVTTPDQRISSGGAVLAQVGYYYQNRWAKSMNPKISEKSEFKTRKEALEAGIPEDAISFAASKHYLVGVWGYDAKGDDKQDKVVNKMLNDAYAKHMLTQKLAYERELLENKRRLEELPEITLRSMELDKGVFPFIRT